MTVMTPATVDTGCAKRGYLNWVTEELKCKEQVACGLCAFCTLLALFGDKVYNLHQDPGNAM